jgi:hypothetical protein
MPRFQDDFYNHTFASRIREDFLSGIRSGVNGTPTFILIACVTMIHGIKKL